MLAKRLLTSLALAALLLWLLFTWGGVELGDLREAIARLSLETYATALAVHASIYVVRGMRFRTLLPRDSRPGLGAVLTCSSAHNLAAYVLPAKTGEATLVVYLRSLGVRGADGLASLVVSRLLDLVTLALAIGVATLALRSELTRPELALPLGVALLAGALLLGALCLRPDLLPRWIEAGVRRLGLHHTKLGGAVERRAGEVADALQLAASGPRLALGMLQSAGIWALVFLFYAVLARGSGLPESVDYLRAVFGSSLAVLFNLLPINGFAGFGTQEAGWSVGFQLLGVPAALALSTGLAVHLVQLANVVLFGLCGHVALGLLGTPAGPRPTRPVE